MNNEKNMFLDNRETQNKLQVEKDRLEAIIKANPNSPLVPKYRVQLSNIYGKLDPKYSKKMEADAVAKNRKTSIYSQRDLDSTKLTFDKAMVWADKVYGHHKGYLDQRPKLRKEIKKLYNTEFREKGTATNAELRAYTEKFTSGLRNLDPQTAAARQISAQSKVKPVTADEVDTIRQETTDTQSRRSALEVFNSKNGAYVYLPSLNQKVFIPKPPNASVENIAGIIRDKEHQIFFKNDRIHPDWAKQIKTLPFDPMQIHRTLISKQKNVFLKDGAGTMPIEKATAKYAKIFGVNPREILNLESPVARHAFKIGNQFGATPDSLDTQLKEAGVEGRIAGIIKRNPGIKDDENWMMALRVINTMMTPTEMLSIANGDSRSNEEIAKSVIKFGPFEIKESVARQVIDIGLDFVSSVATGGVSGLLKTMATTGTKGFLKVMAETNVKKALKSHLTAQFAKRGIKISSQALETFAQTTISKYAINLSKTIPKNKVVKGVVGTTKGALKNPVVSSTTNGVKGIAKEIVRDAKGNVIQSIPQTIVNADDEVMTTGKDFTEALLDGFVQSGKQWARSYDPRVFFDTSAEQDEKFGAIVSLGSLGMRRIRGKSGDAAQTQIGIPTSFDNISKADVDRTGVTQVERERVIADLRGVRGYQELLGSFKEAGSFKGDKEYEAAEHLLAARAIQWGKESGRKPGELYENLNTVLDKSLPDGAIKQEGDSLQNVKREALLAQIEKAKSEGKSALFVQFTLSDRVSVRSTTIGGLLSEFVPFGGYFDNGKGSAFPVAREHDALKLEKADMVVTITTPERSVLASNGNIIAKKMIEKLLNGEITEIADMQKTFISYLEGVAKDYNKKIINQFEKKGVIYADRKNKEVIDEELILLPKSDNYLEVANAYMQELDIKVNSFAKRLDHALRFWSVRRSKMTNSPFLGLSHKDVVSALIDTKLKGRKNWSALTVFFPDSKRRENTENIDGKGNENGESVYKNTARGEFGGLMPEISPAALIPGFREAVLKNHKDKSGKALSEKQLDYQVAQYLYKGWVGSIMVDGVKKPMFARSEKGYEIPFEYLEKLVESPDFLAQKNEAGVKAWFDSSTKTIGAITGMSDTSSFVHEVFHFWEESLSPAHRKILAAEFGSPDSVEYKEATARAFERYLRDGKGQGELTATFAAIKKAMIRIYETLRGTPLEKRISPEVRNVFSEMLGQSGQSQKVKPEVKKPQLKRNAKLGSEEDKRNNQASAYLNLWDRSDETTNGMNQKWASVIQSSRAM
jgi:hypothetical protein